MAPSMDSANSARQREPIRPHRRSSPTRHRSKNTPGGNPFLAQLGGGLGADCPKRPDAFHSHAQLARTSRCHLAQVRSGTQAGRRRNDGCNSHAWAPGQRRQLTSPDSRTAWQRAGGPRGLLLATLTISPSTPPRAAIMASCRYLVIAPSIGRACPAFLPATSLQRHGPSVFRIRA